jgi:RNA polymerase sigma-70 factor (ECF subfamily)
MKEPSADLLNKAFNYDRKSQLELYKLCFPILVAIARRYRTNEEDHVTLVNNAFIKIIQNLDKYKDAYFFSWIKRIMTNEVIDDYRRNKKYNTLFQHDALIESNDAVVSATEYEINDAFLQKIMLELPESTRVVFNLFAIDGYSHKEIGEQLGISEQTSKWHTKMARKKLKELLKLELEQEISHS